MSNPMYFPNLKKDGDRPIATGTKVTVAGEDKACLDVYIQNTALAPVQTGPVQFIKDGAAVEVQEDTVVPGNSQPLPVKLMGTTGDINITAGDLNVHMSHTGVDYDSTRIGDGTNLLKVEADGSINVNGTFSTSGLATEAKQDTGNTSLSSIDGKIPTNLTVSATRLLVDGSGVTQPISAASLPLPTGASTLAEQQTQTTALNSIDGHIINGLAVPGNTTNTPLGISGVFTGSWIELTGYNAISVGVFSDVGSATNGLNIQYSADGVTVHHNHYYTFAGGANGIGYNFTSEFKYFRVVYTNGLVAQTSFELITFLKRGPLFPSSYRLSTTFTDESQVILTKSAITGKTTGGGGGYVDVKVNPSGALTAEADVVSVIPGVGATNLGKAEDSAHTSGDVGVMLLGVRNDNNATTFTSADGDYSPISVTNTGAVRCAVNFSSTNGAAALPANQAVIAGWDGTNVRAVKTDATGQVYITGSISAVAGSYSVVDLFDTPLLDASSSNIPGSASNSLQVIASTAAAIKKIQALDTTGEFIGVYSGPVNSPTLMFIVGPGSDQTIEHSIPAGTLISVRSMTASAITSGNLAMNFMG